MKLDNILLIEPFQRFMIFFTHCGTLPRRKKGNIEIKYKNSKGKEWKELNFSRLVRPGSSVSIRWDEKFWNGDIHGSSVIKRKFC